jgi:hypothetical protein
VGAHASGTNLLKGLADYVGVVFQGKPAFSGEGIKRVGMDEKVI